MSIATLDSSMIDSQPAEPRRRVLLVAYNFPPVGGAGVQRPVKWTKYLRRWGWDVTVLTTLNPSVPVLDESLLADVPDDVAVVRARTWEPDYQVKRNLVNRDSCSNSSLVQKAKDLVRGTMKQAAKMTLQPDPQVLWNYHAIRAGAEVLRKQSHDAILVTAPPYSSIFIGTTLKHRFGLPLVLDFRDEWDLSGRYLENAQRDWLSHVIQTRMQRHLLRRADAVVATTMKSTQALRDKLTALGRPAQACCIYNGFDDDDFANGHATTELPATVDGTFRLVYTGTLWNLTDIGPLVNAIEQLNLARPELVSRLELICVGRKTNEQQAVLDRLKNISARFESVDYCDHARALQWMQSAGALCLLLSDVPGSERVVPAKLFEYLAIRKPILAITPAGETTDIVRRFFPQGQFTPSDVSGIARWLEQRLSHTHFAPTQMGESEGLNEYRRETQTGRLAELLDRLVHAPCC